MNSSKSIPSHSLKVFGNYMSEEGDQIHVSFDEVVSFLRKDEAEAGGIADVPHLYLAQHELKNLPEPEADVSAPLDLMQKVSCVQCLLCSKYTAYIEGGNCVARS